MLFFCLFVFVLPLLALHSEHGSTGNERRRVFLSQERSFKGARAGERERKSSKAGGVRKGEGEEKGRKEEEFLDLSLRRRRFCVAKVESRGKSLPFSTLDWLFDESLFALPPVLRLLRVQIQLREHAETVTGIQSSGP